MTIKILHTADIHLDSPLRSLALRDADLREAVQTATRGALGRIVDAALLHRVAALLIAGDLFDGAARSAKTAAYLTSQLERLREANIPVFYIKGNHDAENPITGETSLPDNVHVFDGHGGKMNITGTNIWIHGVSFGARHAPDSLLGKFAAPVADAVNIAMLHTSLAGSAAHDTYAPCSVRALAEMGFDYWALGHIHKRQIHSEAPLIVMPGIPQGRDIGEDGPKSASLIAIDADGLSVSEIPTSGAEFTSCDIDPNGAETEDDLRGRIRQSLRGIASGLVSDIGVVRVFLRGTSLRKWQILRDQDTWIEFTSQAAQETGVLWLDKMVFDLASPPATTAPPTPVDELADLMRDLRQDPAFAASLTAALERFIAELPPAQRAQLAPDPEAAAALAQDLAEQGATHMIAAMKGSTT